MANLDRNELNNIATNITEVENPDVYSKDVQHINKPISNIKFGHILNTNWDNIVNTFKLIQKFFKETVLNQDVDSNNTANKIVKRNADKSIQVGDIYTSSAVNSNATLPNGVGLAYKNNTTGEIEFTNNYTAFRNLTNTISRDDMNVIERVDKNNSGVFTMWGGSRTIALDEKAKKYRVLIIKAGGSQYDVHYLMLLPNELIKTREHDRNGGGYMELRWDGETSIRVYHEAHRDGRTGTIQGVWGLL